ncbi:Dol-P-Glc:Glc(2)Man(9)GlcNAc(2)-PP-Dol alpha-1-2-glucosyltransferase-like [Homarus americanus]|uniref:Dol-P-Glc:Glc(2)Man(9)GlcNAc(2)-PP-Dol alpha-1,2-glucosyltransferase n=1 Tax=Homarus americanus TaxID=6706 RepID=A0A8J5MWS9_HOMAM|nr:Dol-P-Glc:Glc(2)Man(9)GlcNAc(2)-PP-Dol alpha-1-2-glucosyltransferase-like [Homarus americanus]
MKNVSKSAGGGERQHSQLVLKNVVNKRQTLSQFSSRTMMGSPQPSFIFPLVIVSFTAVSYVCLVVVYTVQPTPFIDEVFHIPQAQKYCDSKFQEWDPKITTLPGLYLFSIGLNGPVSWVLGRQLCDVFSLRITNLVAAAFMLLTIHKLLIHLHGDRMDNWKVMLSGLNLSLLPVLYWFTFLYYTDVLSTLVVLVMILLHLHHAPTTAAAMGVVAVMMRQTNIIWVGFLCVLMAVDVLGVRVLKAPALMKKIKKAAAKPYRLAEVLADVVVDCFSYGIVLAGFLLFVMYNGSVVVGDRSAHEATVHLPQLGYFCLFFLVFSLPYTPSHVRPFIKLCRRHLAFAVAVLVVGVMVVHSNTLVHPYLLADNRHLTFYLWNKLYGRFSFVRYLMVPVYMFGAYMVHVFIQNRSFVFKALFLACLVASVVPHKLLELRYFIVPFLLARMQYISRNWWQLWIETLYFLLINSLTLYLFVSKTFVWEDLPELQRIIW